MADINQNAGTYEKLKNLIDEIVVSTQTVYQTVEQVAKSASTLAKAGHESVAQAKMLREYFSGVPAECLPKRYGYSFE